MSLVVAQAAFAQDVAELLQFCFKQGWVVTLGEAYRTPEQQAIYVKTGRSQTMNSNHLRRCAIDLNFFWDGELVWDVNRLTPIGDFWESLDPKNRWGGRFKTLKDVPHFERQP